MRQKPIMIPTHQPTNPPLYPTPNLRNRRPTANCYCYSYS